MINFTNTNQASLEAGIKILCYGQAGHGKTTLCATAPRPVIISAEAGLLSLARYSIPVAEISSLLDLREMYKWVTESADARNFDTICLDSVSEIAEKLLANAKKTVKDPRQAYGLLIDEMSDVVRAFRDLRGKHVYFTAKQEWIKDDVTGKMMFGPTMPGQKMGQALPYFFDEVFCLRIGTSPDMKQTFRYLQTQPDFQYMAKDRSGRLEAMEMPDLNHVFGKMLAAA